MKINTFNIDGLIEFIPDVYTDSRGSFVETWNHYNFLNVGFNKSFVQDNQSVSKKNVFRGIHLQTGEFAQGKLVRVSHGEAIDFAVDLRPSSSTFGKYVSVRLTADKANSFWVPPGFGHGFLATKDNTIFSYKCTKPYNKDSEVCIRFNDHDLNIDLLNTLKNNLIVSDKDLNGISLKEFKNKL